MGQVGHALTARPRDREADRLALTARPETPMTRYGTNAKRGTPIDHGGPDQKR
jgi:hypothetical protein